MHRLSHILYYDYFFLAGRFIVSTTVVFGRLLASLTGMNLPVLASRPILVLFLFFAILFTSLFCPSLLSLTSVTLIVTQKHDTVKLKFNEPLVNNNDLEETIKIA